MIERAFRMAGLRSAIQRRPALIAGAGCLTVLLTPFVFFPEIMGDVGVTHAGVFRNGAALMSLIVGALLILVGSISLACKFVRTIGVKSRIQR
jgi:hypothetical protein